MVHGVLCIVDDINKKSSGKKYLNKYYYALTQNNIAAGAF